MKLCVLIAVFIAGVSCMHRPNEANPNCIVPLYYAPVCGESGKTHVNAEAAGCYNDKVAHPGKCEGSQESEENEANSQESEERPPAPRPGLGQTRQMLGGTAKGTSRGRGRGMHAPNPDRPDCVVQLYYDPVCGKSGETRVNEPSARCFDDEVVHKGECVKTEAPERLPMGMHRPNPDKPECVVQLYFSPVCGASGKTHINRPTAGCFDDEVAHDGSCEDNLGGGRNKRLAGMHTPNPDRPWCTVQLYYSPVCGASGTTHINKPTAGCFDDKVIHEGKCREPEAIPPGMHRPNPANPNCIVQLYNKPVCAVSGKTYVNELTAGCFNDRVQHEGECREPEALPPGMHRPNDANPDCIVQLYNRPVCAASGRTYVNRPTAGCFRDRVIHEGRCK